jgi:general stress protein 26
MKNEHEKFWSLIDDINVCMVTTNDNGTLRSRPMAPYVDSEHKTIRFITDRSSAKVEELHHDKDIALSFADADDYRFASVSGLGQVSTNRDVIKDLWGPQCDIWFEGDADTADVAVITVKPEQAEIWDSESGKVKTAFEIAKAYFTDDVPQLNGNSKIAM